MSDDLNTLRDEVAEVLEAAARDNSKGRYPESWVEIADALLPLLARRIEAARAEALERITRAEGDANRAIDRRREAYTEGLAEGEARVRARLRMFVDADAVCRIHGLTLDVDACRECYAVNEIRVYDDTLRADVLAEPTGREGADAGTPPGRPETATGAIGGVSGDSRGADEGTGTL